MRLCCLIKTFADRCATAAVPIPVVMKRHRRRGPPPKSIIHATRAFIIYIIKTFTAGLYGSESTQSTKY